jgi:hypothetical protein
METVAPHLDPEDVSEVDEAWLGEAIEDDEIFDRLMTTENLMVQISPWLFFYILLRRARKDLEKEAFTMERRSRQKIVIFDTEQAADLLDQEAIPDYLASLLASFTRIASMTVRVQLGRGVWRRYRTNELDVEGLMRYAAALDEPHRFEPYKRIGDVCLFLSGMFPEHIESQHRYPVSRQIRPGMKGRLLQSREDYEHYGQVFYRRAAEHERAEVGGLGDVLVILSENFVLAEKPLSFLAGRYLRATRHKLFGI